MIFSDELLAKVALLLDRCRSATVRIATAESCTGGLLAALLTETAGSSDVFDRGFVTYSNEAKRDLLGVPESLISRFGAVSPEVAEAMARGALDRSQAGLALAITGVAGPGGGSPEKPVGLVWFGLTSSAAAPRRERHLFTGDRGAIRLAAVGTALGLLLEAAP